jgi:hypothetical protein
MTEPIVTYEALTDFFAGYGLIPRGGFHPEAEDEVPGNVATLILVGNAGPDMWDEFTQMPFDLPNALDHWSKCAIDAVASNVGAEALYPFGGPPFLPFQRWAQKAEPVHTSPLGILIHPEYGLWHAYRGALAFTESIELPPRDERPKPCETCVDKPCLSTCPVGAFSEDGYDVPVCAGHLKMDAGSDCVSFGCRARRHCPVGRDYTYAPQQAGFHMRAFLKAQS